MILSIPTSFVFVSDLLLGFSVTADDADPYLSELLLGWPPLLSLSTYWLILVTSCKLIPAFMG